MTGTVLTARDAPLPGRIARNFARRAAVTLRRLWRAYWAWQVRRTAALLRELDDGMLADIGIERREIDALVGHTPRRLRCARP